MIDIHHHCLPGVDDGPRELEHAVEQLRMAAADGIRTVVATPHRRHPQYNCRPAAARAAHARLAEAARAADIDIELLLGSEVHFTPGIAAGLADGRMLPYPDQDRWFLFELPASHVPAPVDQMIFELQLAGWYPVLAHPERNAELCRNDVRLRALRDQGVRTQVTAQSVTGEFGRRARKASERWLKEGLVDFLATDAHDLEQRPPRLRAAVECAAEWIGEAAARALVEDHPRRLLEGKDLA